MFRVLVLLIVGIAIGYTLGFKDAKTHTKPIISRLVERVGKGQGAVGNDIDAKYDKIGK
jgi:hypothetical protein